MLLCCRLTSDALKSAPSFNRNRPSFSPALNHLPGLFHKFLFERPEMQTLDQTEQGNRNDLLIGLFLGGPLYPARLRQITPRLLVGFIDIINLWYPFFPFRTRTPTCGASVNFENVAK